MVKNKKENIKQRFVNEVFGGDRDAYMKARKDDYCKVQLEWSFWLDALCRDGQITHEQYKRSVF